MMRLATRSQNHENVIVFRAVCDRHAALCVAQQAAKRLPILTRPVEGSTIPCEWCEMGA